LSSVLLLWGCGSTTDLVRPSYYTGDLTAARLEQVYLVTADEQRLSFDEVYKGYEPQSGMMTKMLPFRRAAIATIRYAEVSRVAPDYDADENGYLEEPELLVLYIIEGAKGLGHDVAYIGVDSRVRALATAPADIGGLMSYIEKNEKQMSEQAQLLLGELRQMGQDKRNRGKSGGTGK
jgi:hypothetical protein